jgi:hypothetical protein
LLLIVIVAAVMFGGRFVFGHADGEACSDAFLCRALPARCVRAQDGSFCSRPCSADAECEPGWTCGDLIRERDGAFVRVDRACLKPGAKGPFTAPIRR